MPTEFEIDCLENLGFWETQFYDVNGMTTQLSRKDGYCVLPGEKEKECY